MDTTPVEVVAFRRGDHEPFRHWLRNLKDRRSAGIILARIDRVSLGNFGDCESVGDGVYELRIHFGPGYRVYFGRQGNALVVLLCGGSKRTQIRDVATAKQYWKEQLEVWENQRKSGR
ncbi:MAG: type II toxin-antitoxin system RelE/ParE family toxin [Bryobacteraceae bacterium]